MNGLSLRVLLKEPTMRTTALCALAIGLWASTAGALDEGLYAALLERHTVVVEDVASVRVDYEAMRSCEMWADLIQGLRESDPADLRSRNERLAFWINAYNILAVDLVRRRYPIDSVRSIPVGRPFSPAWGRTAGRIGGRYYTLSEIEHEILRPMGEPRMHAAIACPSVSCPPLRREPYRAAVLDAQLDDSMARWLGDARKGARIDRSAKTLYLSPILRWFAEDFGDSILAFVTPRLPAEDASWIREQRGTLRIRYFEYDDTLNVAPHLEIGLADQEGAAGRSTSSIATTPSSEGP
jgi:hypothetical protein